MKTAPLIVGLVVSAAVSALVAIGVIGFLWIVIGPVAAVMTARIVSALIDTDTDTA